MINEFDYLTINGLGCMVNASGLRLPSRSEHLPEDNLYQQQQQHF